MLSHYGFSLDALKWIESYLTNRGQTVFFNGSYSKVSHIECGVPQGSCLGPLLFSIFINDLPLILDKSQIAMYADDSTIYAAAKSTVRLNRILAKELELVVEWVLNNKLVLNAAKTKSLLIGSASKLKENLTLNLVINNIEVEQVRELKLLGIIIDQTLSWTSHINNVVGKMGRGVAVTRRVAKGMTKDVRKKVLTALVLSHLD